MLLQAHTNAYVCMCAHEAGGDQKEAGVNKKDDKLEKVEVGTEEGGREENQAKTGEAKQGHVYFLLQPRPLQGA